MRFKDFLTQEAGKVHTIPNPAITPRGAPEEPARAFDKPGTDRSELRKQQDAEFEVVDGWLDFIDWSDPASDELLHVGNTLHLTVKSKSKDPSYQGVSVMMPVADDAKEIPNDDVGDVEPIGSSPEAAFQAKHMRAKILKACVDAIRAGTSPVDDVYMASDAAK